VVIGAYPIYVLYRELKKSKYKKQIYEMEFPVAWEAMLEEKMKMYKYIPDKLREKYKKDIMWFINSKYFKSCNGLEMNEEIKLLIASQACLLTINLQDDYPKLQTILVYPNSYVASKSDINGKNYKEARLGESWNIGTVVLSWQGGKNGIYNSKDGHNVAIHEFAHQLDQEDGVADGVPILSGGKDAYINWIEIFEKEYEELIKDIRANRKVDIDEYGATNEAEFFAVITEAFFEKSLILKKTHEEIYNEMKEYFKIDPAEWIKKYQDEKESVRSEI